MSKKDGSSKRTGTGLAIGLAIGLMFAVVTGNNALFVIGIAIGVALESQKNN